MTDEKLIEAYKTGDNTSLEFLIKKYLQPIYGYVFSLIKNKTEAEDITQEVFVKMWKNIKKFNTTQSFKSWIFTIAKNTTLDFIKKKKNIPFSAFIGGDGVNLIENIADEAPTPLEKLESYDRAHQLYAAVEGLPIEQRETLQLRYADGLKFKEIASHMHQSIDTVKTRHRRGLERLKRYFKR